MTSFARLVKQAKWAERNGGEYEYTSSDGSCSIVRAERSVKISGNRFTFAVEVCRLKFRSEAERDHYHRITAAIDEAMNQYAAK